MPWIHEIAINKAKKRLSMLGGDDSLEKESRKTGKVAGGLAGGMAGAAIQNATAKRKRSPHEQEQALVAKVGNPDQLPEYKQESGGSYMSLFPQEQTALRDARWDEPGLPYAVSTAQRNQNVNGAAQLAPIGGHLTERGRDEASKKAEPMSKDITMGKQLMRYGGMLQSRVPPLQGDF